MGLKSSQIGSEVNQPPLGGGLGKMQHSPIKQNNPMEQAYANQAPPEESLMGLMGQANQRSPGPAPVKAIHESSDANLPPLPNARQQQKNQALPQDTDKRDNEINELSNMVKNLLNEQQELKNKLAQQET